MCIRDRLYLVIGEQVNLTPIAAVVLLGFVLVVCFGGMSPDKTFAQGLKAVSYTHLDVYKRQMVDW